MIMYNSLTFRLPWSVYLFDSCFFFITTSYFITTFHYLNWYYDLVPVVKKNKKCIYSLKEQILAYLKYYFTIFLFLKTPSERKMIYYNTIIAILSLLPWISFSSVLKEINNKIKRYIVFLPLYSSTGLFTTKNQETLFNFLGNILLERLETHHKLIKFSIKDFFSKCDQIRKKFPIWSHLLEKPYLKHHFFEQWKICGQLLENLLLFPMRINPFLPYAPFLYPLKTSENLTVFWCFQGVAKGCIGSKWFKHFMVGLILDSLHKKWGLPLPK